MQTAATKSRFITGCSSKVNSTDPQTAVSRGGFLHTIATFMAQAVHSRDLTVTLTNRLIQFAEQAFVRRDVSALEEISRILMNLPLETSRQIGTYYYALAINRKGEIDKAEALLQKLADCAPMTYRARALQTLGANFHDKGQLNEALRLQIEALRVAADRNANGLQTTMLAFWEISSIKSFEDDHKGALADLESLRPLVNLVARKEPFYLFLYCNDLAFDLGQVGRIAEAEAALDLALASPYAPAYPNWAETRKELDAKRTSRTPSVVPLCGTPEALPAPQTSPHRRPLTKLSISFCWPAKIKRSLQRSIFSIPQTARVTFKAVSILDWVLTCLAPRAPPFSVSVRKP
jgi:tetratricopeptide (TPR) repeat protein